MKYSRSMSFVVPMVVLLVIAGMVYSPVTAKETKSNYNIAGIYVEGCSCSIPCVCEMTGLEHGCQGVGAMSITSGKYKGTSLAGAKIAYAAEPGGWITAYVDIKNPKQLDAAKGFAKEVYKDWGKMDDVKQAKIEITGKNGKYELSVDNGKIMQLTTEPVLGGDKKNPISHSNVADMLNHTFYQAKTLSGKYEDGDHSFTLKDSNSYFNDKMKSSGKL